MRQLIFVALLVYALVLPCAPAANAYTLQYTNSSASVQVKWPNGPITIALSASLNAPPSNIEATPAEVVAAARRALKQWADAANIQFNVVTTGEEDLDPNDGTSVITVSVVNANQFNSSNQKGRARIRFDASGTILEGDVGVNPQVRFSTDGRSGTNDLESTFVHEIGHILGLEHSGVVGATMQPRQGENMTTYNLPALTARTLADDDRAGIRSIYGPRAGTGSISGTINYAGGSAAFGAHVWAEDTATGRVMGGNIALPSGAYRIDGLPHGSYRVMAEYLNEPVNAGEIASRSGGYQNLSTGTTSPFLTTEAGTFSVQDGLTTNANLSVTGANPFLNPSFVGMNSILSTIAVPIVPGRTTTVLVGGNGVTDGSSAILATPTVNSPFMTVSNVQSFGLGFGIPVISFDVTVAITAPPGEYSIRLQSSNEVAFVTGALVVDLPNGVTSGNPIVDNETFFVAQQYRDFLNREPDAGGLDFWTREITSCGADAGCREVKRINVSAAFFLSPEFQDTGFWVVRAQRVAFGRRSDSETTRLSFAQFIRDSRQVGEGFIDGQAGSLQVLERNRQAYATQIVSSDEFIARFPTGQGASQYVGALFASAGVTPTDGEQQEAIDAFNAAGGGLAGRVAAFRKVTESSSVRTAEFRTAFVLMQYFGYMRRDPDQSGYNFWLSKLNQFNGNYVAAEMVKAFIVSSEYQERFGQ